MGEDGLRRAHHKVILGRGGGVIPKKSLSPVSSRYGLSLTTFRPWASGGKHISMHLYLSDDRERERGRYY